MVRADDAAPEFSRIVNLGHLGEDAMTLDLRATEGECAALARRFSLPAIAGLSASGGIERQAGGRVRLLVSIRAEVTQTCVVTLEPVVNRIEEQVDILFEPERGGSGTIDVAFDPAADREPLSGDSLDVGEIVAEEMALALDPYPRKPGVGLETGPGGAPAEAGEDPPGSPFEALAALRRKE